MGKIVYSTVCEQGLVRENNQDSVFADVKGKNGIFCVADGMGGYEKGEVASGIIVKKIEDAWNSYFENEKNRSFRTIFNTVSDAIKNANEEIYENYNKDSVCGSTVVVLLIYGRQYGVFSTGDSRIYSYDGGSVCQETVDDVWENLPEQRGQSLSELRKSPKYGKLTNAIGTMRNVKINYSIGYIYKSTFFMLCSDGIYKMCSGSEIERTIIEHNKEPEIITDIIREKVIMNGAKDNLSLIALYVHALQLFWKKKTINDNGCLSDINERTEDPAQE